MAKKITPPTPKENVEQYFEETDDARHLSQRCRDYFDHKQWTPHEAAKLKQRHQAPIVVNKIKPKVEGLLGLYEVRKSDPKALPRTYKHEQAAHVVTDGLRYVMQNTDFNMTRLAIAEDFFVEGIGGAFTEVSVKVNGETEISISRIPWDRIAYDPHSRQHDFKDARWMAIIQWMNIFDVEELLPNVKIDKDKLMSQSIPVDAEQTSEDRPRWKDRDNNRVRVVTYFEKVSGFWKISIFSEDYDMVKLQDSPFVDEDGVPMNPIELVSANTDRDNYRYSEVAGFLSQQDEINHRRSKFLHQNSTRQTFGNAQAIQDVESAKRELRKPDGHIAINGNGEFGKDFGIIPTSDMSNAQFSLYQDAKRELDEQSFGPEMAGNMRGADLSGDAIGKLQVAGATTIARQYAQLSSFEKRIYRQVWARIKQFWQEEKWLRVTDEEKSLRWVGFNSKVTGEQLLMENIADKSATIEGRQTAQKTLEFLRMTKNPKLQEIVDVKNKVPELDMDIIIEQSIDSENIQQEQFRELANLAQGSGQDFFVELLELSTIRGKDELLQKINARNAQAAEAQQAGQEAQAAKQEQLDMINAQSTSVSTQKKLAETQGIQISSITKQIENAILVNNPDTTPQVIV